MFVLYLTENETSAEGAQLEHLVKFLRGRHAPQEFVAKCCGGGVCVR